MVFSLGLRYPRESFEVCSDAGEQRDLVPLWVPVEWPATLQAADGFCRPDHISADTAQHETGQSAIIATTMMAMFVKWFFQESPHPARLSRSQSRGLAISGGSRCRGEDDAPSVSEQRSCHFYEDIFLLFQLLCRLPCNPSPLCDRPP